MNKKLIALAVAVGIASPLAANAGVESKWFGYSQITASKLDQNKPNDGLVFGADRVRIGYKVKDGKVFGGLQIDFNETDTNADSATLDKIIKDAFGGYKFSNAASIKLGQFKTPVGMDFNTSGAKLDITKRGMEKKLVLERAAGAMLSGRKIAGGVGYDLFYGNPSTRSSAAGDNGTAGKDNTFAARVMYDMGKLMHVELSYGSSSVDGGTDYDVLDFGLAYKRGPITGKFEYIEGDGVSATASNKEKVWYLHLGYQFSKMFEGIVRHYEAKDTLTTSSQGDKLGNTYIGANIFLGSNKTNGRLQLNYVVVSGDDANSATPYAGVSKGYTDDAILVQYQVGF